MRSNLGARMIAILNTDIDTLVKIYLDTDTHFLKQQDTATVFCKICE